jgi:hypothetical protein
VTNRRKRLLIICVFGFFGFVALVGFSSAVSRSNTTRRTVNPKNQSQDARTRKREELWSRFPTVDYNAPEPTDSTEKEKRKQKNKHYDGKHLVMETLSNSGVATMVASEAFFQLPPLPISESGVILIGHVLSSEGHLSNDKAAVYTELNVQVDSVLKGAVPTLSQTNLISVTRIGGTVRYPSGRTQLYAISNQNMPRVGTQYLFFLKSPDDAQVYELVTGYEVGEQRVEPLDIGSFDKFSGMDTTLFLGAVRDAIAKS